MAEATVHRPEAAPPAEGEKDHQLFELLPDAAFVIDHQSGRILDLNSAAATIYGYTREELCGLDVGQTSAEPELTAKSFEWGRQAVTVRLHRRKDGSVFPAELAARVINWGGREVVVAVVRDVSDRTAEEALRESERALRLSEVQTRLALHLGHAGTWVYTVETNTVWGSAEGLKMFGYAPVAKAWPIEDIEVCIPERERVHQALVDLITAGRPYDLEYEINPADGAPPRQISSIATVESDAQGRPLRVLGFVQDITERKRAETERAHLLTQAVEARKLRDEVLGIVSHDLRNPLNAIALSAAVLARKTANDASVAVIQQAVARAKRLIEDLLLASSVDAGALSLDRRLEPVGTIVTEVAALHTALAQAKSVTLEENVDDPTLEVFVDRHRMVQLLSNLVANAIAFTPTGGQVRVRARRVDGQLLLEVADTGPGISPEDMPRLFDRFWQGARAHRAGAGLGLAIAKGIADAHGAALRVESAVGKGTTFTVSVATVPPPAGPLRAAP